jgi:topoisomerase-4 subunit A
MTDWENNTHNLKRCCLDATARKQNLLGDAKRFSLDLLSDTPYARIGVKFGGGDSFRAPLEIEAEEFIQLRSVGTKGKRISNYNIESITELEPTRQPELDTPADAPEGEGEEGGGDAESLF